MINLSTIRRISLIRLLERQKLSFAAKLGDSKILKRLKVNPGNWRWNFGNYPGWSCEQIRRWRNLTALKSLFRMQQTKQKFVRTILVLTASVERPLSHRSYLLSWYTGFNNVHERVTRLWLAETSAFSCKCKVVTRVHITNSARMLSKFRLSWLSVMFVHVHY